MATLSAIASAALGHLALVQGGESADADDLVVAVASLRHVLARLPNYGAGRALVDRTAKISLDALPDDRVICQSSGLTITMPLDPMDGTRVAVIPLIGTISVTATDRKLEGATSAVSVSAAKTWAYRADLADWVEVTTLADSDQSPWPDDCESALEHFTALECAAKFEVGISSSLGALISDSRAFIRAKYARPRDESWSKSVPISVTGPGRLRGYR